ncbi:hypothetical protein ACA910_004066 [Epithemia clementina (nom. ined.)]
MGRFCLVEDEEEDVDGYEMSSEWNDHAPVRRKNWQFVADVGAEGSLVTVNKSSSPERQTWEPQSAPTTTTTNRPIFYIVPNPLHEHDQYDYDPSYSRRMKGRSRHASCVFLCQVVMVAILSTLYYYIWMYGPPAPPLPPQNTCQLDPGESSVCLGESEKFEGQQTWKDFRDKHNAALAHSLRAYLVDTTWHILSWTIPQIVADLTHELTRLQRKLRLSYRLLGKHHGQCSFSPNPRAAEIDMFQQVLNWFPTASAQPHAVLPFVQKLETDVWGKRTEKNDKTTPIIFWASQMTPGLAVSHFAKTVVEISLPGCPSSELPFAVLEMVDSSSWTTTKDDPSSKINRYAHYHYDQQEQYQALQWINRIRHLIENWERGGIVVLDHVDRLPPGVLRMLLGALNSKSMFSNDVTLDLSKYFHSSDGIATPSVFQEGIVFILISEKIGRSSMARHLRQQTDGGREQKITDISRSSLVLDIQHEISSHLGFVGSSDGGGGGAVLLGTLEIIPFWFLTRDDIEQAMDVLIQSLAVALRFGKNQLVVTWTMQQEMLSEKRVEIVQLNTLKARVTSSGESDQSPRPRSMLISTNGIAPVLDQILFLETKLKQCIQKKQQQQPTVIPMAGTFELDFDKLSHQVVFLEANCDDRPDSQCLPLCSFYY